MPYVRFPHRFADLGSDVPTESQMEGTLLGGTLCSTHPGSASIILLVNQITDAGISKGLFTERQNHELGSAMGLTCIKWSSALNETMFMCFILSTLPDTVKYSKYLLVLFRGLELMSNKITYVKVFSTEFACSRCPEDVPLAPPSFLRSHIT